MEPLTIFAKKLHHRCSTDSKYASATCCIIVSPPKVWGHFSKKLFMVEGLLGANLWGELLYMGGLIIRSCQVGESFTMQFSSNLNTVNPKIFPDHGVWCLLVCRGRGGELVWPKGTTE